MQASGRSSDTLLFAAYDHARNARLDSGLYLQRWMAESAFSVIKRRYGSAVRHRAWYREFRELVLTAAVYNLERSITQSTATGFNKVVQTYYCYISSWCG